MAFTLKKFTGFQEKSMSCRQLDTVATFCPTSDLEKQGASRSEQERNTQINTQLFSGEQAKKERYRSQKETQELCVRDVFVKCQQNKSNESRDKFQL